MRDRERGSILVEALVATAIVGLMVTALYGTIGDAAGRSREADDRRAALMTARSALSAAGAAIPLTVGRTTGVDGDLLWEVNTRPEAAGGLVRVEVVVRRRGAAQPLARLSTLRLVGTV